jgi:post-segregation antitoxin (ccd killing protein)
MSTLTIRIDPDEKKRLLAWASLKGVTVTDYLKGLVAADIASGTVEQRVAAWYRENAGAIAAEAEFLKVNGVPGADLTLHHPRFDDEV